MKWPILNFSPLLGTADNAGGTQQFCSLVGPRECRSQTHNSEFAPLIWDPRECKGDVAIPPTCGP